MDDKKIRIIFATLTVAFIIFFFYNKHYVTGSSSVLALGYQVYHFLNRDDDPMLVDMDEAEEYYLKWIESVRRISIPEDREEVFCDETAHTFRFIWKWFDEIDGCDKYAPIEVGKYYVKDKHGNMKIQLLHGRGLVTENYDDVNKFITRGVNISDEQMTQNTINIFNDRIDDLLETRLGDYKRKNEQTAD